MFLLLLFKLLFGKSTSSEKFSFRFHELIVAYMLCFIAQLFLILCEPVEYSRPGSFVHGDSAVKNIGVDCCHASPPGNLPNPGIEPRSPTLQADSSPFELPGKSVT